MSEKDNPGTDRQSMLNSVEKGHNVFDGTVRTDKGATPERRPLLKGLAVSLGSVVGFGGTAAADSKGQRSEMQRKTEEAMDGYRTPANIRSALNEYGSDLMAELAQSGFLRSANTAYPHAGEVKIQKAPAEVDPAEGTYVTASKYEGVFSAHISIVRKTPTHVVRLNVRPQLEQSFATIKSRDDETVAVVNANDKGNPSVEEAESSDDGVSIQKVCGSDGYKCPPGACCSTCSYLQQKQERICCKYSDGTIDCYLQPVDKCCDPLVCC